MVSQYFPPDVNGPSTRAYNAALGLKMQGCNVTVVAAFPHYPNGYQRNRIGIRILYEEKIDGINVIRTWVPNLPHWPVFKRFVIHMGFALSSILAILIARKVDIIISMNQSFFAFFPSLIYGFVFRKNILRNVDDLWPEVLYELNIVNSRILKRILDYIAGISYRIPSAIISVSQGYIPTLVTKYHVPKEKIRVIEHGVNIERFSKHGLIPTASKKRKKIIMYSGNLNVGYDFDLVFASAALLKSEPMHFVIRGTGQYSKRLHEMAMKSGLNNVEVRTDVLSPTDLLSLLISADIFLLPMSKLSESADQGLPTKVLEYQAIGKPIVCISSGEVGSYIKRTESGLVGETRTPNELADLIRILVRDEDLASRLGSNGFNHIRNNLTLESVGKQWMDVIRMHCSCKA